MKWFSVKLYLYFRLQSCYSVQSDFKNANDKDTVLPMASILFRYLKNSGDA
jgi:hypothetical protein